MVYYNFNKRESDNLVFESTSLTLARVCYWNIVIFKSQILWIKTKIIKLKLIICNNYDFNYYICDKKTIKYNLIRLFICKTKKIKETT